MLNAKGELEGLSDWPAQKLTRARTLGKELKADVDAFGAAGHFYAEVEARPDHFGADIVMHVREKPPLAEYSLRLGEIIHNTRSALDSMLWEVAGLGGASASKRGMVTYPANLHVNEWTADRQRDEGHNSGLSVTLDATVLERVKSTQPFAQSGDAKLDGLAAIARLSNYDKHRGMVATLGVPTSMRLELPLHRVKDPKYNELDGDLKIDNIAEWALVDGLHTQRFAWSVPMTIEDGLRLDIPWHWAIADPQLSSTIPLDAVLLMPDHAEAVMHYVRTGSWP